jgi:hypothetical protein
MHRKPARRSPLDDLILKVCHIELMECSELHEFREGIRVTVRNLEETLSALALYRPPNGRIRRAMERVKMIALHLLELCRAVPDGFDDPNKWRDYAMQIAANYEQFRIEAGHLYHLTAPGSSFDVLRSAL